MVAKLSAGLLMYRFREGELEVFLAHPGGPYFAKKDDGAWSIPKGLPERDEALRSAALREFQEETGLEPVGELIPLGSVTQRGGKKVHAWAFAGDWDPARAFRSNTFEMEWPPRSGRVRSFPEIDRVEFFPLGIARRKINPAQEALLDRLLEHLSGGGEGGKGQGGEENAGMGERGKGGNPEP